MDKASASADDLFEDEELRGKVCEEEVAVADEVVLEEVVAVADVVAGIVVDDAVAVGGDVADGVVAKLVLPDLVNNGRPDRDDPEFTKRLMDNGKKPGPIAAKQRPPLNPDSRFWRDRPEILRALGYKV